MMIKSYDDQPKLPLWKRVLRNLLGGQDFVCLIYYLPGKGEPIFKWFSGVDLRKPIAVSITNSNGDKETTVMSVPITLISITK